MSKVSYSKIEEILDDAFRKILIERLGELAAIATMINDPDAHLSAKVIDEIIIRFQTELKKMKEQDKKFFLKLELTEEEEKRFMRPSKEYATQDWERLRTLKEKIDEVKTILLGEEKPTPEDEKKIEEERQKHINKRYNIRDGWLPLH